MAHMVVPALNPMLDVPSLAARFARLGYVQIADFLDEPFAKALAAELADSADWVEVLNAGDKVYEFTPFARDALAPAQAQEVERLVYRDAQWGFQYRYDTIRVADGAAERAARNWLVDQFAAFMGSDDVLTLLRTITGRDEANFVDAQATRYRPGAFLTGHDDDVAGKGRVAAYVLGLSPAWRMEWGGLLILHSAGDGARALVPQFNTLNLFAVPQLHSVSQVTPFAVADRHAVTGWLRAV